MIYKNASICLTMIVKNEEDIILKCLNSVLPFIDTFVICDTGSTDNTKEIIETWSKKNNIQGSIYDDPWVDFGTNRSNSLSYSKNKAEYTLIIDADETLLFSKKNFDIHLDAYDILTCYNGVQYKRTQLLKNNLDWKYIGVLHEYPYVDSEIHVGLLQGISNKPTPLGNRSKDRFKYQKDCLTLELGLLSEPNNTRYIYYMAQSYRDCNQYEKAIEYYEKRIKNTENSTNIEDEVYLSYLSIAYCKKELKHDNTLVLLKGIEYDPNRLECIYEYGNYLISNNLFLNGYNFLKPYINIKKNNNVLCIEPIYDYKLLLDFSICANKICKSLESLIVLVYLAIYKKKTIPDIIYTDICVMIEKIKNILGFRKINFELCTHDILSSNISAYELTIMNYSNVLEKNRECIKEISEFAILDKKEKEDTIYIIDDLDKIDKKNVIYYSSKFSNEMFVRFLQLPLDKILAFSTLLRKNYNYYLEWFESYVISSDYKYILSLGEPPLEFKDLVGKTQKLIILLLNELDKKSISQILLEKKVNKDEIGWIYLEPATETLWHSHLYDL